MFSPLGQSASDIAGLLLDSIIASKDIGKAFEDPLIDSIAACPRVKRLEFERKLKDAFGKTFSGREEWRERLKIAIARYETRLSVTRAPGKDQPDLLGQTLTDDGNAERLLAIHGEDMRYCPPMKCWLIWDGMRWKPDESNVAQELAVDAMRQFLRQVQERITGDDTVFKFAYRSLNSGPIKNLLGLASSRRPIMPMDLDSQPWALNCMNGTVDLRTRELTAHRREDMITRLVHFEYVPDSPCDRWRQLLDWTMCGGPDAGEAANERAVRFVDYLQCAFGYSVTGLTSDKAVFILHGEAGDNGKTTMSNAIRYVVQEYSASIGIESLMMEGTMNNNAQSDLADLRGARFVQTSEAQKSQKLNQAMLKRLSAGSGTFRACRKFENVIEFPQTWKIWIDTNPLPALKDPDDKATITRLHPIPFNNHIEKEDMDMDLPAKLEAEATGILAWLIEGAFRWFRDGLKKPREVDDARNEWQADQDQVGRFVEECCVKATRGWANELYAAYRKWAEGSGERHVASAKEFGSRMGSKYSSGHSNRGNYYEGVGLRATDAEIQP